MFSAKRYFWKYFYKWLRHQSQDGGNKHVDDNFSEEEYKCKDAK